MDVRRFVLAATFVLVSGCLGETTAVDPTPTVIRTTFATASPPSRSPADLPVYPEEAAVIRAVAEAGFRVDRVGVSKFEDYIFGERKRARLFGAPIEGTRDRIRVDVLFLDAPAGSVSICPDAGTYYEYSITIDGRRTTIGAIQPVFFAVGDHFFVMATDGRVREALFKGLGLATPLCSAPN